MDIDGRPRRGRPRSESVRRAILDATVQLLAEEGYSRLTIDRIAERAGAGRQTIYRWWPTKADVVLDATADRADLAVPVVEGIDSVEALRAFVQSAFTMASRPATADLLTGLAVEAQLRPDFGVRFRAAFLEPRRRSFIALLDRVAEQGARAPSVPSETLADVVFGVLWYRMLITRRAFDDALTESLLTLLTGAQPAA